MRNESESESITRPEAMSVEDIRGVLESLTVQTEVRIWYWTKEKFLEEQYDEYEYDEKEDFVPLRDGDELAEPESSAVELDTCLYATVTEVEDYIEMDAQGGTGSFSFATDGDDGIHHIQVTKVGFPPAEDVDYHHGHYDLCADPSKDYVDMHGTEVGIESVQKLHAALGRWLEHKGIEL